MMKRVVSLSEVLGLRPDDLKGIYFNGGNIKRFNSQSYKKFKIFANSEDDATFWNGMISGFGNHDWDQNEAKDNHGE